MDLRIGIALSTLLIACDPHGVVRGTVVDPSAKTPVADAHVVLDCAPRKGEGTSDAQGRFETRVAGFLDKGCALETSKDGYKTSRTPFFDKCDDPEHCRRVEIEVPLEPAK